VIFQLKLMAFVGAGLLLGLIAWRMLASRESKRIVTQAHWVSLIALNVLLFAQNQIYGWFALVTIVSMATAIISRNALVTLVILTAGTFSMKFSVTLVGAYIGEFTTVSFVLLGVMLALPFRPRRAPIAPASIIDVFIFGFTAVLLFMNWGQGGSVTRLVVSVIMAIVMPYLVLRVMVRTRDDVHQALVALVFVAIMLAGNAVIETLWRWPIYHTAFGIYGIDGGISAYTKFRGSFMRIPTVYAESTSFGVFLVTAFIAAVLNPRMFRSRSHQIGAVLVIGWIVVFTFSRSAIVTALFGMLVAMMHRGQLSKSLTGIALASAAVLGVFALAQVNSTIASYVAPGRDGDLFDYRRTYWEEGTAIVRRHPISGVNEDQMMKEMPRSTQSTGFVDSVNAYLFFAIRAGLWGGVMLFLMMAAPFLRLWVQRRGAPNSHERRMTATIFGAIFALIIAMGFTAFTERNPIWIMLCAALAIAATTRRRPTRPAPLDS
jgi:O-antigen ligase